MALIRSRALCQPTCLSFTGAACQGGSRGAAQTSMRGNAAAQEEIFSLTGVDRDQITDLAFFFLSLFFF